MSKQIKKAYDPGYIHGILSDFIGAISGDPGFRTAYSNPELQDIFKVDPLGKPRGVYLDLFGILKQLGDKRRSEVKIDPREKKRIEIAREYLKHFGMPSPTSIYSNLSDEIRVKPLRYISTLPVRDTGIIFGSYTIGDDYIRIARNIEDNFKQSLGIATFVKQLGENKISIPPERENAVKRILYGAYLSSGFIPEDNIDTFYNKIRTNKDFRSRYIKAMLFPAYCIALHEAVHKKTFEGKEKTDPYGRYMLYKNPGSLAFGLSLLYKQGMLSLNQAVGLAYILSYTFNTAEIDAQLSTLKRWYQIQTGKPITTLKEAEEAMENISKLLTANEKIFSLAHGTLTNQFFSYKVNKKILEVMERLYTKRFLERGEDEAARAYRDIRDALTTYLYRLAQL